MAANKYPALMHFEAEEVCESIGARLCTYDDLKQGGALAAAAIDGGKAKESLEKMIAISNEAGP